MECPFKKGGVPALEPLHGVAIGEGGIDDGGQGVRREAVFGDPRWLNARRGVGGQIDLEESQIVGGALRGHVKAE